jgi:hypothetical protein
MIHLTHLTQCSAMNAQELARCESKELKSGSIRDDQKALTHHLRAIQKIGVQVVENNEFPRGSESDKLLTMLECANQIGHLLLHASLFFAAAKSDGYSSAVMYSLIKFSLGHRKLNNDSGFLPSCLWIFYPFIDSCGKQAFAITSHNTIHLTGDVFLL